MHPSVCPSIMLSPCKSLGGIFTNLATGLPRVVRVCESNIVFHTAPCDLQVGSKGLQTCNPLKIESLAVNTLFIAPACSRV